VTQNEPDVLFGDIAIFVEIVKIEDQLDLAFKFRIIDLKHSVDELLLVHIGVGIGVEDTEEPLGQDAWQVGVLKIRLS
jgi:hypothetical protein